MIAKKLTTKTDIKSVVKFIIFTSLRYRIY